MPLSLCTISGTIYKPNGAVYPGATLKLTGSRRSSTPLSTISQTVTADNAGAFSFTAVQGSIISIQGDFISGSYNFSSGLDLYVPKTSTAVFTALLTVEDKLDSL